MKQRTTGFSGVEPVMDQNMIFGNLDENDWKCQNSFLNDGK